MDSVRQIALQTAAELFKGTMGGYDVSILLSAAREIEAYLRGYDTQLSTMNATEVGMLAKAQQSTANQANPYYGNLQPPMKLPS